MLYSQEDAPHLKGWIVKRLANTSDADADVLADYILALLGHDGDITEIRQTFEAEIPDFLREDTTAFTNDVFQAVKYRSYLPGAAPAPPVSRPAASTAAQTKPTAPSQSFPQAAPTGPSSRKRALDDDNDVDFALNSRDPVPGGGNPYKQPRRERGGFAQRGGRFDDSFAARSAPRAGRNGSAYPQQPAFGQFQQPQIPPGGYAPIDPNAIIENMHMIQQMSSMLQQSGELPRPVYSGSTMPPQRKRKGRCRDYDEKGYCSRGNSCMYEHGSDSIYIPQQFTIPGGEEYDPGNAVMAAAFGKSTKAKRKEAAKSKRAKGRPEMAATGPIHNRAKSTIIVQNIPQENFTDEQIRSFFGQFGEIVEVSLQPQQGLATIKYDTWDAANAAWSSPKVIFDNRFVKVFWQKDESDGGAAAPNGKGTASGAGGRHSSAGGDGGAAAEPDFDMEEFLRKQEEAQKLHDEKAQKRQEFERQRKDIEERQKELRARQLEERRKLKARLAENGGDTDSIQASPGGKSNPQTESLRMQLAALEEEANSLGIDPDALQDDEQQASGFSAHRGGWRGRGGGYRGSRGGYAPRGYRGGYAPPGRGGGGAGGGVEARHAAYAQYSLDLRPKAIALSGADFTVPEKDEALRQYLFGIGEFKDIRVEPTTTHVWFHDRKTAEQFMFGVSASHTVPGLSDKLEVSWSTTPAPQQQKTAAAAEGNEGDDVAMTRGLDDAQNGDGGNSNKLEAGELEDGEIDDDDGDMDYDAGDWN